MSTPDVVSLQIVAVDLGMIYRTAIENEFHGNHALATNCMDSEDGWSVHKMAYEVLELVEFVVSVLKYF